MIDKTINKFSLPNTLDVGKKNELAREKSVKVKKEYNNNLLKINTFDRTSKAKEEVLWGHFDLSLSELFKDDNLIFASSFSMSVDIYAYDKNGISEDKEKRMEDIFKGEDFDEFKKVFLSINGSEESLENFNKEVDELFFNISNILELDEKDLENSKKLLKFGAKMYSEGVKNRKFSKKLNDLMADSLGVGAKLHGLVGNTDKMLKNIDEALSLRPESYIADYLNDIKKLYSNGINKSNNVNELLYSLNNLGKLSAKYNQKISNFI